MCHAVFPTQEPFVLGSYNFQDAGEQMKDEEGLGIGPWDVWSAPM